MPADEAVIEQPPESLQSNMDAFEAQLAAAAEKDAAAREESHQETPAPENKEAAVPAPAPTSKEKPAAEKTATEVHDEVPSDIKSEEGKSSWKKLKESKAAVEKERDTIRTERDTLNTRLAELEKAAKTPAQQAKLEDSPEYKRLTELLGAREKELEEFSERLRLVNVEAHPKFQAYFKAKVDEQMTIAKEIGGDNLVAALQLPAGDYKKQKLNELVVEMDEIGKSQLGAVLSRLREIDGERAREINDAKANYQKMMAEQEVAHQKERQSIESTFKSVSDEVMDEKNGLSVFRERNGDEEWNKGVKERLAIAQAAYAGKLTPENRARNAFWGAAAPVLLQELNGMQSKIQTLESELQKVRSATPSPGGEKAGAEVPPPQSEKKGIDALMDSITQNVQFPSARR